ncbi:MAG: hypothetical protein HQK67_10765 [Desulfamplus sp.]|nr:hypothetical protein [Desulfamplus sp.]
MRVFLLMAVTGYRTTGYGLILGLLRVPIILNGIPPLPDLKKSVAKEANPEKEDI